MHPLSEDELDQLFDYFNADERSEDCLDFYGLHGLLTAHCISPVKLDITAIINKVFDGNPDFTSAELAKDYTDLIARLLKQIENELVDDEQVALPFDLSTDLENDEQHSWCAGFLDLVFEQQDDWFAIDEEAVATLLLPIEVGSELFADEDDFKEIAKDKPLKQNIINQIPEVLIDLFLLTQVPVKGKKTH